MIIPNVILNQNHFSRMMEEYDKIEKEFQILIATIAVGPQVKSRYLDVKNNNSNLINSELNEFNKVIDDTKKMVETTVDGNIVLTLVAKLVLLVENSEQLADGVNSIKVGSNNYPASDLNLQIASFSENSHQTITMLDEFIDTRNSILNAIPTLKKFKQVNNEILNDMEKGFIDAISELAEMLPRLSFQEVKNIADLQGLFPEKFIDLEKIDYASELANKKIKIVDSIADSITQSYQEMRDTDNSAFANSWIPLIPFPNQQIDYQTIRNEETVNYNESTAAEVKSGAVYESPAGWDLPNGNPTSYGSSQGNLYPYGQCTWYVFERRAEISKPIDWFSGDDGNAMNWINSAKMRGMKTSNKPGIGDVVVFQPGVAGADQSYGHVAVVEQIKGDTILISEANVVDGKGTVSYRTIKIGQGISFIK